MSHHHTYKVSVKKLPETCEVEIKSAVPADEFAEVVKDTLEDLRSEVTLPGFRKGAAPEKIVREKIGATALLSEAAEHAISHAYGHILDAERIDAIGRPKVTITKLAEGNPLEFTIVTSVVPEVTKYDYKKIAKAENAKKDEPVTVSDADVEKAILDIRKSFARGVAEDKLPELTDELVKSWGEFKDVADFKAKVRDGVRQEKEHRAHEKKRLALVDALTTGLEVVIPDALVESELARMEEQMSHDIERMGITFDEYLKHLKKTRDDLKKEWNGDAVKRVKLDLALAHIAKEEKIEADKKKVDDEVAHVKEHHKDLSEKRARSYFAQVFQNQAVFEFLESVK